jgi:hypothetical protein
MGLGLSGAASGDLKAGTEFSNSGAWQCHLAPECELCQYPRHGIAVLLEQPCSGHGNLGLHMPGAEPDVCCAFTALQDSRTPALAVVLSVTVNILSNLVAVAWLGLSLKGAAATTVATQVIGCCSVCCFGVWATCGSSCVED